VIAEEMGRANAPVPFSSTVYLAAEALLIAGSDAQKKKWLPAIASGEAIGTLALFEGKGNPSPKNGKLTAANGVLNGVKKPVADGAIANFAVVAARTGSGGRDSDISLFLVDLRAGGVEVKNLTNLDPTRGQAEITFKDTKVEPLGAAGDGWSILTQVLDRAAVLCAFEQVGGSDRALEMGRDYALDRIAFAARSARSRRCRERPGAANSCWSDASAPTRTCPAQHCFTRLERADLAAEGDAIERVVAAHLQRAIGAADLLEGTEPPRRGRAPG